MPCWLSANYLLYFEELRNWQPGTVRIGGYKMKHNREKSEDFTNPLPQKVDYDLTKHLIYHRQKKWKKVLEWIFTIIAWILLASYIIYLLYGSLAIHYNWYLPEFLFFTREMIETVQWYFYILFIAFLFICIFLIFWKNYNKQKYGKLHRRKFKPPVTNEELSEMFELEPAMLQRLQSERVIVLEKNIIPKHMGMGSFRKQEKYNNKKDSLKSQRDN